MEQLHIPYRDEWFGAAFIDGRRLRIIPTSSTGCGESAAAAAAAAVVKAAAAGRFIEEAAVKAPNINIAFSGKSNLSNKTTNAHNVRGYRRVYRAAEWLAIGAYGWTIYCPPGKTGAVGPLGRGSPRALTSESCR